MISDEIWARIIDENRVWFAKDTMRYWNTTVLWETATAIGEDGFAFLTLDDDYTRQNRAYSVRKVDRDYTITTPRFQQWYDLVDAKDGFYEYVAFELGR